MRSREQREHAQAPRYGCKQATPAQPYTSKEDQAAATYRRLTYKEWRYPLSAVPPTSGFQEAIVRTVKSRRDPLWGSCSPRVSVSPHAMLSGSWLLVLPLLIRWRLETRIRRLKRWTCRNVAFACYFLLFFFSPFLLCHKFRTALMTCTTGGCHSIEVVLCNPGWSWAQWCIPEINKLLIVISGY